MKRKIVRAKKEKTMHVEQRWCDECVCIHWLEVEYNFSRAGCRLTCHGAELYPVDSATHIVKSDGPRGYLMIRRTTLYTDLPVVLAPIMERKPVEVDF